MYKSILLLFPVELSNTTDLSLLMISDSGIEIANPSAEEKSTITSLESYLTDSSELPVKPFLFILNKLSSPEKPSVGLKLFERSRILRIAISILTSKACFERAMFHYNDTLKPPSYYKPLVIDNNIAESTYFDKPAVISIKDNLDSLKLIYNRLTSLKLWGYNHSFSKLSNAVKFYELFINKDEWILQKIVFAISILESVFSDSKTEIAEKIAVRTTYFLFPNDVDARHKIYNLLKTTYDCRSQFLHGSNVDIPKIEKKLSSIKDAKYSFYFDLPDELLSIISQVLLKIISEESYYEFFSKELTSEEESDFYNQLVLGKNDK